MSGQSYRARKNLDQYKIMERLQRRSKNKRIINDILFIRIKSEGNSIFCWNTESGKTVVVTRRQWQESDVAITRLESCMLLAISDSTFDQYVEQLGIIHKRGRIGENADNRSKFCQRYYSVEDLCLITDSLIRRHSRIPSSWDLRELFRTGYMTYKQGKNGEWIPTWDESIF
jgi:hypothetical protein